MLYNASVCYVFGLCVRICVRVFELCFLVACLCVLQRLFCVGSAYLLVCLCFGRPGVWMPAHEILSHDTLPLVFGRIDLGG